MDKKIYFFIFIIIVLNIFSTVTYLNYFNPKSVEREDILMTLEQGILKMQDEGKYECCIEPACKMCYFGNWIFENGECYCDNKIKEGKFDEVCPECKSGIEQGLCKSSKDECVLDEEVYG